MKRPKFIVRGPQTLESAIDDFKSDVEGLKEEIESWKDNLENNSMEHLPKYEEVSECFDALEEACEKTEEIELPDGFSMEITWEEIDVKRKTSRSARASDAARDLRTFSERLVEMIDSSSLSEERKEELRDLASKMNDATEQIEAVSFPGMY